MKVSVWSSWRKMLMQTCLKKIVYSKKTAETPIISAKSQELSFNICYHLFSV